MLNLGNSVLLVIDIQTKLLNVMSEKEALLENAQKLIKGLQLLGVPIIITEQNPRGLGPTQPGTDSTASQCLAFAQILF